MTFHHLESGDGVLLIEIARTASPAGFSAASVAGIIRIIIGIDIGILHEKSEDRVMIAQSASDAAEVLIVDAALLQMFDVPIDTGPEGIIGIPWNRRSDSLSMNLYRDSIIRLPYRAICWHISYRR